MTARDVILSRIYDIIYDEGRPFSFKDFIASDDGSNEGKYAHGTVRNIFSQFNKEGLIKIVYRSPQAFYTLAGVDFRKGMTPSYRGVISKNNQDLILRIFKVNRMNKPAIHDIRLLFNVKGLRNILLCNNNASIIDKIDEIHNKDIRLKDIIHDDIVIKTTVHNTDNVSVMIACSDNPIEIEDPVALSKLTGGLTRVEERLQQEIIHYLKLRSDTLDQESEQISIPYHMNWIVKMWHFGRDSSLPYSGELFEITWKEGLEVFYVYSKKRRRKNNRNTAVVIRSELQQYPNASLKEAIKSKLDSLNA